MVSSRYTADGKRKSSVTHASRSWDCGCGRRCWGNGGKASHRRACVVHMQDMVDRHLRAAEFTRHQRLAAKNLTEAHDWQLQLNARVEKERVV